MKPEPGVVNSDEALGAMSVMLLVIPGKTRPA
jgi:hypothetical protein